MAALTSEDKKNYENLRKAFEDLNVTVLGLNISVSLDGLKYQIQGQLPEVKEIENTDELSEKVELVDGFLKLCTILILDKLPDIPLAKFQEVANLNEELKRSLKALKDETLDLMEEIEDFCFDTLFMKFLGMVTSTEPSDKFTIWTNDLLSDRDPNLNEKQIERLIEAWGTSVSSFVEDAKYPGGEVEPVDSTKQNSQKTLASFFCIHNELEILYSRLADTETAQKIS